MRERARENAREKQTPLLRRGLDCSLYLRRGLNNLTLLTPTFLLTCVYSLYSLRRRNIDTHVHQRQWQTTVTTFYNAPLTVRYPTVVKGGKYTVVVVYVSENVYLADDDARLRSTPPPVTQLTANGVVVHSLMPPPAVPQRLSFPIPAAAVAGNTTLELQWTMAPNAGGSGAGNYVAEVMLQLSAVR